ncbi:MAG: gliding motility-associated C-terminal domain-containing protein, partial [Flavobacterium sp.]
MELKTTFRKIKILFLLFALFSYSGIYAQTRIFATTVSSSDDTDNASNAIDQNLGTRARVRASSGIAVGIGQYSGHIELQFDSTLPQNTTTYVKIGADANLFPALLGGSLGGLLSDVLGGVLVGNQEFTVQAKNGNAVVLQGNSQIASDFGGQRLRVITNAAGEYFLMITPNQQYNRIRLTNRVGSLLGLGNTRRLDVFEAFYVTDMANCGSPAFTSFSGSGISLDALQLGGVGVENPQFAIDANQNNFSTLSVGLLG